MKFMIAIIIMFAPPNYPEVDMLLVDKKGEEELRFDEFDRCAAYVYENIHALHLFAYKSYAPKEIVVDHIACLVDPTTKGRQVSI
tara:strand:+ start:225 stop:479 length:255 start_codon:yes stop_codon:yes gene_type:complete